MFAGWRRVQLTWELWFCARHSMVRILKLAKWHSWLQLYVLTCAVRLTFVPGERTRSLSGMASSKMHFVEGERHHWIEEWANTKQSIQKRFNTIWWFWCRGVLLLSFEFLFWHRSCGLQVQTVKTQALEASNNARLLCVCEFSEDSLSLGSVQHSRGPFGQWNLPAIRDGGGWWRSQCRFGFELWWTLMPRFESFLIFLSQAWHHQEIKEYFPFWFFFPWDPASEAAKSCCERWRAKFHHTLEPPDSGRRGLFRSV